MKQKGVIMKKFILLGALSVLLYSATGYAGKEDAARDQKIAESTERVTATLAAAKAKIAIVEQRLEAEREADKKRRAAAKVEALAAEKERRAADKAAAVTKVREAREAAEREERRAAAVRAPASAAEERMRREWAKTVAEEIGAADE